MAERAPVTVADGPEPPTLLTFAPMIDSELCRLLLDHYGVRYGERPHLFGWASLLALRHGGTGRIPMLYGRGLRLIGPRALVDHFDRTCAGARRLVPARQPLRTRVQADWERFNGELAAHTAVVAYFHLLPPRDLLMEPFSRGIPAWEASLTRPCYPLLRGLFTLLLRLSPGRAADALIRVRLILDQTDARLADGRSYLTGETLTLSDLALATAAAPLLLPPGYRAPIPALERMPTAMQAIVGEMRRRPTARFVERLYAGRPPQTEAAARTTRAEARPP